MTIEPEKSRKIMHHSNDIPSKIRRGIFDPEVVAFIQCQYKQSIASITGTNEYRLQERNAFRPDDALGKTWNRLYLEDLYMSEQDESPLSIHGENGFLVVTEMLAGLWTIVEGINYKQRQSSHYPKKFLDTALTYTNSFDPYRSAIEAQLYEGKSLRTIVGQMMGIVDEIGIMMYSAERPVKARRDLSAFRVGSDIAWKKWQILSTNG